MKDFSLRSIWAARIVNQSLVDDEGEGYATLLLFFLSVVMRLDQRSSL
jgi:hypothetical protein